MHLKGNTRRLFHRPLIRYYLVYNNTINLLYTRDMGDSTRFLEFESMFRQPGIIIKYKERT